MVEHNLVFWLNKTRVSGSKNTVSGSTTNRFLVVQQTGFVLYYIKLVFWVYLYRNGALFC